KGQGNRHGHFVREAEVYCLNQAILLDFALIDSFAILREVLARVEVLKTDAIIPRPFERHPCCLGECEVGKQKLKGQGCQESKKSLHSSSGIHDCATLKKAYWTSKISWLPL